MAIWEKAKARGDAPGSRVDVDASGSSWVKILSPKFRQTDNGDHGTIGYGIRLIFDQVEPSS